MKVLMAPVNIAGQPLLLVEELKKHGIDARLLQYCSGGANVFGYQTDNVVNLSKDRQSKQFSTLKSALSEGYDIFHFWLRTFFYGFLYYDFPGIDLPFIKVRGKKIVYRFTGFDLRLKSEDLRKNPYSVFRYGYNVDFNEDMQKRYIAFLEEYVDEFIVQDPEMHSFFPKAKIIPRVINLDHWPEIGVDKTDCPLVVHAPSTPEVKGSYFVHSAIKELQAEGLCFAYKPIVGMRHEDAIKWYKKADIIIDQLHIGWYGVLSIEGMALGKPVVVYIREALQEQFERQIPIQNANPDNIKENLRELIKDHDKRNELGQQSRKFIENVHDIRKVVPRLISLYNDVVKGESKLPNSYADIDYFDAQLALRAKKLSVQFFEFRNRLASAKRTNKKIVQLMDGCGSAIKILEHKLGKIIKSLVKKVFRI